eukprot:1267216-Prymnesium_polylepis.1
MGTAELPHPRMRSGLDTLRCVTAAAGTISQTFLAPSPAISAAEALHTCASHLRIRAIVPSRPAKPRAPCRLPAHLSLIHISEPTRRS